MSRLEGQCLNLIEQGFFSMFDDKNILDLLSIMSDCYNHSLNNQMLIFKQKKTATDVCGAKAWAKRGAKVKGNERPIIILNPFFTMISPGKAQKNEDGSVMYTEEGEVKQVVWEKEPEWRFDYHAVPVFDISQVEPVDTEKGIEYDGHDLDIVSALRHRNITILDDNDTVRFENNEQYRYDDENHILYLKPNRPDVEKKRAMLQFLLNEMALNDNLLEKHIDEVKTFAMYPLSRLMGLQTQSLVVGMANKMKDLPLNERKAIFSTVHRYISNIMFNSGYTYIDTQETAFINHLLMTDNKPDIPLREMTVARCIRDEHPDITEALDYLIKEKVMMAEKECITELFDRKWNQTLFTYPPFVLDIPEKNEK